MPTSTMTDNASVGKESDNANDLAIADSLLLLHEPIVPGVLTPNHSVGEYSSPEPAAQQRKSSSTSTVFEQKSSESLPQSQSSNRIRITVPVHMRKKNASPVQDDAVDHSPTKKTVRRSGRLKGKGTNSNKPYRPSTSVDDVSVGSANSTVRRSSRLSQHPTTPRTAAQTWRETFEMLPNDTSRKATALSTVRQMKKKATPKSSRPQATQSNNKKGQNASDNTADVASGVGRDLSDVDEDNEKPEKEDVDSVPDSDQSTYYANDEVDAVGLSRKLKRRKSTPGEINSDEQNSSSSSDDDVQDIGDNPPEEDDDNEYGDGRLPTGFTSSSEDDQGEEEKNQKSNTDVASENSLHEENESGEHNDDDEKEGNDNNDDDGGMEDDKNNDVGGNEDSNDDGEKEASDSNDESDKEDDSDVEEDDKNDDEDNSEQQGTEDAAPTTDGKPKQTRDRHIYDMTKPWRNQMGKSFFQSNKEVEDALLELGCDEFQMNGVNGLNWKRLPKTISNKGKTERFVCCCHYKNESNCPFVVRVSKDVDTGWTQLFIGNRKHSDHTKFLLKRGVPSVLKAAMITSPTSLATKGATTTVRSTLFKKKLDLPAVAQKKAARAVIRARKKYLERKIPGQDANTYEGLAAMIRLYRRHELEQSGEFNKNSLFVCGDDYICDSADGKERVAVLFSSENLLLNAYRQTSTG